MNYSGGGSIPALASPSKQRPANQAVGSGTTNPKKPSKTQHPGKQHPSSVDPSAVQQAAQDALSNIDPTKPMTLGQLQAAMNSAVNAKYGMGESDLQTQIGQSTQRQAAIPEYYRQYLASLKSAQTDQQNAYNQAAQASAVPGEGALNQEGNLFSGLLASRGANAYSGAQQQINQLPQMQLGATENEAAKGVDLGRQLSTLHQQAGDYGNQWLIDAIQQERANQINQDTLTAAGYKQSAAQDSATAQFEAKYGIDPADIGAGGLTAAQKTEIAKFQAQVHPKTPKTPATHNPIDGIDWDVYQGYTPAQRAAAKRKWAEAGHIGSSTDKDQYGNTPAAQRAHQNSWDGVLSELRSDGGGKSQKDYQDYLSVGGVSGTHYPSDLASIATYWAAHKGHVTQDMIDALHKLGIKIGQGHLEDTNPYANAAPYSNYPAQG